VKQGIQGVPTEVSDGSIQQMDAEMAKKYPQGTANMVSLAEYGEDSGGQDMTWGMYNRERRDGMDSSVLKGSAFNVAQSIEPQLSDNYNEKEVEAAVEAYWTDEGLDFQKLQNDDFWEDLYYNINDIRRNKSGVSETTGAASAWDKVADKNSPHSIRADKELQGSLDKFNDKLGKIRTKIGAVKETTSSGSAGAFSAPMGYSKKKQVTETTTSASSGQYSGPRIWAKSPESSRFAHKPAWKGGQIVSESVINGDKDYLTEAKAFRAYIVKNEIVDMLNEAQVPPYSIGEAENFQMHYQKVLDKILQHVDQFPELANDPDIKDAIKINSERAGKPVQQQPQQTGTVATPVTVSEHHLDTREDKSAFIIQNGSGNHNPEYLATLDDAAIDALYRETEQRMGIGESDYTQSMEKDLKYTGHPVKDNESANELESQDGLFKGRWNENLPAAVETSVESEDEDAMYVEYFKEMQGEPPFTIGSKRFQYVWAKYPSGKVDIGVYDPSVDLVMNYNIFRKMHGIDESKLNETKKVMKINTEQYKEYLKKKLTENAKTLMVLNEGQKKNLLKKIHEDFVKESMIDDQPDSMINNSETSMVKSMDTDELNTDGMPVASGTPAASPVGGVQQEGYDTDDMKSKRPMADKLADYSDEEPVGDDSVEEPASAAPQKSEPSMMDHDRESPDTISDAEKFRQMLKAKYGVDSVSALSPLQRQELMKTMNFGGASSAPDKNPIDMDFSQFKANDAQKAAYQARDQKRLDYIARNANRVNSVNDYMALAKQFKAETGEGMFHPMAILASIEQLPQGSQMRNNLSNVENVLRSQMTNKLAESIATTLAESLNEERKPSSILNVEKLGAENAKNFKSDSAKEDALDQSKTYPKPQPADSIQKAAVYPNPKDFYIDQDVEKVNREAKSMADIEREVLAKTKGEAFNNVGNSTNEKGNEIPKRNLTKEEAYELAMNRGDGMNNIVYDNKPSERFEKRMEADMGADVYKNRTDKMEYRADMPMYNKDTQPTAGGDKKEENNKFKMGYNNESVSAKYRDEFGKVQLVEFAMKNVVEVTSVADDAVKLNVDGMGNKYSLVGKKINENTGFKDFVEKYAFYMTENKVVAIEKTKVIVETKIEVKGKVNESFDKMKHLMNYKPNTYVDGKKSVKF
jgi:hypothetical protein